MSDETNKPSDDWLSIGKPTVIRTRGAVRARGVTTAATAVQIRTAEDVPKLLQQLDEEVRYVPWVIVVDGKLGTFAENVCLQAKQLREGSRFSLVSSESHKTSPNSGVTALNITRFNTERMADQRFLDNLIADLVIVTSEPQASQKERLERWLLRARYVMAEKPDESLIEKIQMLNLNQRSNANVVIIRNTI